MDGESDLPLVRSGDRGAPVVDLLPPVFDRIYVGATRRRADLSVVRSKAARALLAHLHLVIQADLRLRSDPDFKGSAAQESRKLSEPIIRTRDRFASGLVPREDLVHRVATETRFKQDLADVTVLLIEGQVDNLLLTRGRVALPGVGAIEPGSLDAVSAPFPLHDAMDLGAADLGRHDVQVLIGKLLASAQERRPLEYLIVVQTAARGHSSTREVPVVRLADLQSRSAAQKEEAAKQGPHLTTRLLDTWRRRMKRASGGGTDEQIH